MVAWDIPDEKLADAVSDQARQLASINPDELPDALSDILN